MVESFAAVPQALSRSARMENSKIVRYGRDTVIRIPFEPENYNRFENAKIGGAGGKRRRQGRILTLPLSFAVANLERVL
jgi:polysaccharide deacetylase 2 family uncharacterized protein YibQ